MEIGWHFVHSQNCIRRLIKSWSRREILSSRRMRIGYFSNWRATKDLASLRIYADSSDASSLAYTKYWCRWRLRPSVIPLALLYTSVCAFKGGFCAYAISASIPRAGTYPWYQIGDIFLSFCSGQMSQFLCLLLNDDNQISSDAIMQYTVIHTSNTCTCMLYLH